MANFLVRKRDIAYLSDRGLAFTIVCDCGQRSVNICQKIVTYFMDNPLT